MYAYVCACFIWSLFFFPQRERYAQTDGRERERHVV